MSIWTYVIGAVEVDTLSMSDAEAMYTAQTVVNHLPRIRGSEGDVEFYFSKPNGHDCSSNCDEFGNRSNLGDVNHYGLFTTQQRVLITLSGSLRDAEFHETLRQVTKMLTRLSSRIIITKCVISVSSYNGSFVFDNPQWLNDMEITDWAVNHLGHSRGGGHDWGYFTNNRATTSE